MKLSRFKEWLSLDDTANYLSISLGEAIEPHDILKLGIDGVLPISIYLSEKTPVLFGKLCPREDAEEKLKKSSCEADPFIDEALAKVLFCDYFPRVTRDLVFCAYGDSGISSRDLEYYGVVGTLDIVVTWSSKSVHPS